MLIIKRLFTNKIVRYAYLGWFTIALFYSYQYILRVAPGVLVEEIRGTFHITAEQFSTLGFYYLLAYSVLQIPLGILVDRIGVKITCIISILLCAAGTAMLAYTETFAIAQLSRFIIGAGSGASFMCAIKFISDHIPPGNRGLLMGATLALGTVGALLSGRIVTYLDVFFGWREAVALSVPIGIVILILMAFFLKSNKQDAHVELYRKSLSENLSDIMTILRSRGVVLYAVLAIGLYTPLSAIADLWGTAFLMQKFSMGRADAAQYVMFIYIGLTFGSLLLPWISERLNKLNTSIIICSFALLICFSILLYAPITSLTSLLIILFLIGFFGGAEMMCFTGALVDSNRYDSGQIIGVVNTLNMLGGAMLQLIIGYFLDLQWDGLVDFNGIRQYSTLQFENSLSILTVLVMICSVSSLVLLQMKKRRMDREINSEQ